MSIDIRSENGAAIAVLSGEIDHHSARDMRAELDRFIITMQPELMAMDFGGITFMDSSGVGSSWDAVSFCGSAAAGSRYTIRSHISGEC